MRKCIGLYTSKESSGHCVASGIDVHLQVGATGLQDPTWNLSHYILCKCHFHKHRTSCFRPGMNVNSNPRILYTVTLDPIGDSEMRGGSSCGGGWKETLQLPHQSQWPLLNIFSLHASQASANPRELILQKHLLLTPQASIFAAH